MGSSVSDFFRLAPCSQGAPMVPAVSQLCLSTINLHNSTCKYFVDGDLGGFHLGLL